MAYSEKLAERVAALFEERAVTFATKRMMGGLCYLVDDKMCVGVEKERLMVRLDPEIYETVLKEPGCSPMDFTGRPLRGFVFVATDHLKTKRSLGKWLDRALAFNPKAKRSKKRK